MTPSTTDNAHLTTSRVNRLLRPLRNKCNSLAALPMTAAAFRVTYSKQSSSWDPGSRPPLTIFYFSARTKKSTLEGRSEDEFELSRRIHAVCDAFKNIAYVAFGRSCSKRIPSLAALCTVVVGENIPSADSDSISVDSGEDSTDGMLDVDDIYEAVPPHYRRFLIVSHALSMILSNCTHHHTLLMILLDHCLSFGLLHESTHLLNIILAQAFLPSNPSNLPLAMHPGHTNYLLDLHAKWTAGNKLAGTSPVTSLFTTSAFCQAVLGVLSRSSSCNLLALWTSKILNRWFYTVQSSDMDSYIFIVQVFFQSFWDTSSSIPDTVRDNARPVTLRDKFSEMMSNLFDLLFVQHGPHSPSLTLSRICAVVRILCDCHAARLHRLRMSTPGSTIDLPDMIIVFTTHIFVAFRNSVNDFDRLLAILDGSSPVPTTFSKLMAHFTRFQGAHCSDQAFGHSAEAFLTELELYSSALRSEKLFRLDASLWACGLRHFETSMVTSQKCGSTLVSRYKQQLMQAVDTAERRCFGGDMNSSPVGIPSVRPIRNRRTHHAKSSGQWEWEGTVESWIQKTPIHKKRKVDDGCPHTPLQHSHSRPRGVTTSKVVSSIPVSVPLSTRHRRSSTFSLSSSYSQFSDPESHTEDGSEYQETDKENYPGSPQQVVKRSHRIERHSSNFLSLLTDAKRNRIVLHSKPHLRSKPLSSVIPEKYVIPLSSQDSRNPPSQQEQQACYTLPPIVPSRTIPLSDDSLDLFAYATSSPARC